MYPAWSLAVAAGIEFRPLGPVEALRNGDTLPPASSGLCARARKRLPAVPPAARPSASSRRSRSGEVARSPSPRAEDAGVLAERADPGDGAARLAGRRRCSVVYLLAPSSAINAISHAEAP